MLVYQEGTEVLLSSHLEIIVGELNVKSLDKLGDPDTVRTLSAKPNYRNAGIKLGKSVKEFAKYLQSADLDGMKKEFGIKGTVGVTLEGRAFTLEPGDVLFETHSKGDWSVAEEAGLCVALDTRITDDLRREGLARDLVRAVQSLRKDADLHILDRIRILYATEDSEIERAVEEHREYILHETLGIEIAQGDPDKADRTGQVGQLATVGVIKV
jgi:isoleucyl-tRNA synthetase